MLGKICTRCNKNEQLKTKTVCKECKKELDHIRYLKHQKEILNQFNIDYRKCKKEIFEYLGGKCSECGCTNCEQLEFHHIDPSSKEFVISDCLPRKNWKTNTKLMNEIKKCTILCVPCHDKITLQLIQNGEIKNISRYGELNGRAKLTAQQVIEIFENINNLSEREMFIKYPELTWPQLYSILNLKTWKFITDYLCLENLFNIQHHFSPFDKFNQEDFIDIKIPNDELQFSLLPKDIEKWRGPLLYKYKEI